MMYKKPVALKEWRTWHSQTQKKFPIQYFIRETVPLFISVLKQYTIEPILNFKYYLYNRFISKPHQLSTTLTPGKWYDLDTRILYGMFDSLVDFVEIEAAWHNIWCDSSARKKYKISFLRWHAPYLFRWTKWRSKEAGVDYFNWASKLIYDEDSGVEPENELYKKSTPQAEAAKEVLILYNWWTNIYPNRPDPHATDIWDKLEEKYNLDTLELICNQHKYLTTEDQELIRSTCLRNASLEQQNIDEEQDMLRRLIAIRHSLWT